MLMRAITKVNGSAPMIIALRKAAIGLLSPAASKSVPIRAVKMMPQMIWCLMLVFGLPPDMIVFMIRTVERRRRYQEGHDQNRKHDVERCQEAPDQHLRQGDKQFVDVRRGEDQPVVMVTKFMASVPTGILWVSVGKLDEEFERVTFAIHMLIRGF